MTEFQKTMWESCPGQHRFDRQNENCEPLAVVPCMHVANKPASFETMHCGTIDNAKKLFIKEHKGSSFCCHAHFSRMLRRGFKKFPDETTHDVMGEFKKNLMHLATEQSGINWFDSSENWMKKTHDVKDFPLTENLNSCVKFGSFCDNACLVTL